MKDKKIITILIIIIILASIILITKIITKTNVTSPLFLYNELDTFDNVVNNQINSIEKDTAVYKETFKTPQISINYSRQNHIETDIYKDVSSLPKKKSNSKHNQITNSQNIVKEQSKKVDIIEQQMKNKYIYGIVKNITNQTIEELKVSADYYDEDGNKLSTAVAFLTTDLEPNETWKFEMFTSSKAVTYKNLKVTYK